VMVSLHRSEGLGLHLMEAMSLRKVVVATGWSGNMDFMTDRDSVPVGYRMVPVSTRHSHYLSEVGRPGQEWAEADVGEAARALRMLHEHPERRQSLGEAAERSMTDKRREMLSGKAFERMEAILARAPTSPSRLDAALRATRRRVLWQILRAGYRDVRGRMSRRRNP
jgi:glycosyltransferase involved in cell wall biosynthesis